MRSNTQAEGVDPKGAFSPAARYAGPSLGWRTLLFLALCAGAVAGFLGLAGRG